jgi:cephalosporin-C deacetylase
LQTGLKDTICPPSSQLAAFNKITSKKKVLFYPDFAHEDAPGHWDIIFSFLLGL